MGFSLRLSALVVIVLSGISANAESPDRDWTQWGGPDRNFTIANSPKLIDAWPASGPKEMWRRDLGDGYSTIVSDGKMLYTMYRNASDEEVVVALNAATGAIAWEYKYAAPFIEVEVPISEEERAKMPGTDPTTQPTSKTDKQVTQFGEGPNSTPLLCDGRIYTIGFTSLMHCLDAKTGALIWKKDLYDDGWGTYVRFGYAASPLEYKDTIIVLVGEKGHGVVAFEKATGKIRWQAADFAISYSSPILVNVDGEDHLIVYTDGDVVGMSPTDGTQYWSVNHQNEYRSTICTPIWCAGNTLFFLNGGDRAGGKAIRLKKAGDKFVFEDLWQNTKIKSSLNNAIPVKDMLYVQGDSRTGIMMGVDTKTGEIEWRQREMNQSKGVLADGKLILTDEKGNLILARPKSDGLEILAKAEVLESKAWTAPTLVGDKLFLRDRKKIVAIDLAASTEMSKKAMMQ